MQARLEEKLLYPLCDQILLLLLRICDAYGIMCNDEWYVIQIFLSNRDLANIIGSTRETINRYLNDFKKDGIINYSAEGHLLINKKKINELILLS
nr:helix-turn-helix domain-containing protein [Fredinandcohnia sp. SECRCQ15]